MTGMTVAEIRDLEQRIRSLVAEARLLPPGPRQELEPLTERVEVALAHLQVSQLLADEQLLRDRLEAARRAG